jgi:hypothetical protein
VSKERPLIFSSPMIRAILNGSKSQTRRVMKFNPPVVCAPWESLEQGVMTWRTTEKGDNYFTRCPYGKPGDMLWIRETHGFVPVTAYGKTAPHRVDPDDPSMCAIYRAGFDRCWSCPSKPSIHMPRWASRILLRITDIRVERVQDISEEDAIAEGVELKHYTKIWKDMHCPSYVGAFSSLWDSINCDRGHGWDENDWVWVVSFERAEAIK